jgi:hypothetical protein
MVKVSGPGLWDGGEGCGSSSLFSIFGDPGSTLIRGCGKCARKGVINIFVCLVGVDGMNVGDGMFSQYKMELESQIVGDWQLLPGSRLTVEIRVDHVTKDHGQQRASGQEWAADLGRHNARGSPVTLTYIFGEEIS